MAPTGAIRQSERSTLRDSILRLRKSEITRLQRMSPPRDRGPPPPPSPSSASQFLPLEPCWLPADHSNSVRTSRALPPQASPGPSTALPAATLRLAQSAQAVCTRLRMQSVNTPFPCRVSRFRPPLLPAT